MPDNEFGTRDSGECRILPPPTRLDEIDAALLLYRRFIRDYELDLPRYTDPNLVCLCYERMADCQKQIERLERERAGLRGRQVA